MKNNFTYAIGRTLALVAFLAPTAMQILPPGWQDVTLGFLAHAAVTYINEYLHAPSPVV